MRPPSAAGGGRAENSQEAARRPETPEIVNFLKFMIISELLTFSLNLRKNQEISEIE